MPAIKKFLTKENVDLSSADEPTKQKLYKDWLTTIDYNRLEMFRQLPVAPDFGVKIDPIIAKMCDPDFSRRYQSITEALVDLKNL